MQHTRYRHLRTFDDNADPIALARLIDAWRAESSCESSDDDVHLLSQLLESDVIEQIADTSWVLRTNLYDARLINDDALPRRHECRDSSVNAYDTYDHNGKCRMAVQAALCAGFSSNVARVSRGNYRGGRIRRDAITVQLVDTGDFASVNTRSVSISISSFR